MEVLVFVEGGKGKNPEKKTQSRDENQQQTQPTHDVNAGNQTDTEINHILKNILRAYPSLRVSYHCQHFFQAII